MTRETLRGIADQFQRPQAALKPVGQHVSARVLREASQPTSPCLDIRSELAASHALPRKGENDDLRDPEFCDPFARRYGSLPALSELADHQPLAASPARYFGWRVADTALGRILSFPAGCQQAQQRLLARLPRRKFQRGCAFWGRGLSGR